MRLAPMRFFPFSYFCTCWKVKPRASPSFSWLIASIIRRMRTRLPTCLSIGFGALLAILLLDRLSTKILWIEQAARNECSETVARFWQHFKASVMPVGERLSPERRRSKPSVLETLGAPFTQRWAYGRVLQGRMVSPFASPRPGSGASRRSESIAPTKPEREVYWAWRSRRTNRRAPTSRRLFQWKGGVAKKFDLNIDIATIGCAP